MSNVGVAFLNTALAGLATMLASILGIKGERVSNTR